MNVDGSANEEEEQTGEEAEEDGDGGKHEREAIGEGQLEAWTQCGALVVHVHVHHIQNLKPQHVHHHHTQQGKTCTQIRSLEALQRLVPFLKKGYIKMMLI